MAASNGTLVIFTKSGKTLSIDVATPDAVATYQTFNPTGLAASTSPSQLVIPEDGVIVDYIQVAAPTAVGFAVTLDSAVQPGGAIRYANQLCTLANRAKLQIPVRKGQILTALQF